jgi:GTP pyrophosphokinase
VPLETKLNNGDVIEIVTNKNPTAGPSRDWLNFVKSPRARSKIKAWFTKERREEAIDAGRESIARQMRKAGLPLQKIFAGHSLLELAHELRYPDIDSLYSAVGDGHISPAAVIDKLMVALGIEDSHPEQTMEVPTGSPIVRRTSSAIEVEGEGDVLVKLARCCTPVPGDEIMGFITRGSGVSVHRKDCVNAGDLTKHQHDRVVKVKWLAGAATIFLVNIQVEALDRAGLLSDITKALADQQVNILNAAVSTSKDRVAISRFTFEMANAVHLDSVLAAVRQIEGVYDVARVVNN